MFKQENLKFIDNKNNLNISYLSLINEISFQTTYFNKSKEIVNDKNKILKDLKDSNFNRPQEVDLSNIYVSNFLSHINQNIFFQYNAIRNSFFNPFSLNSFLMPPPYPFYYFNQLYFAYLPLYNNILNISYMKYNNVQIVSKKKEPPTELINRKRKPDKSISLVLNKIQTNNEVKKEKKNLFVVRIKKKYILTIKYIEIKKEEEEDEEEKDKKIKAIKSKKLKKKKNSEGFNIKKYSCEHIGCECSFGTKKLGIFHHFKMSPECQEDSIYLLKLIFETKKLLLKNIEKKEKIFGKFSSLYEEAMRSISLDEYVKTYDGLKFQDNL